MSKIPVPATKTAQKPSFININSGQARNFFKNDKSPNVSVWRPPPSDGTSISTIKVQQRNDKLHLSARARDVLTLKQRIGHLEKIVEELQSRNDSRDIERYMQCDTLEHQSKLLKILQVTYRGADGESNRRSTKERIRNHELLLHVRANYIRQLLDEDDTIRNLLQEKQSNESAIRQTESLIAQKTKLIHAMQSIVAEKDRQIAGMEESTPKSKTIDQQNEPTNVEERIATMVMENLRYKTLRTLTQV